MEQTLLATKLFIPPQRPGLVSRPRLLEQLQACLDFPLMLVSAPAGYGKTTPLSEWTGSLQTSLPVGWLSLEEDDNNPQRFWRYLISAICRILPDMDNSFLSSLGSSDTPIEAVLTLLINEITNTEKEFVLVLDDYHFIKSQPIHQGVTFFLEHIPPLAHIILSTRIDPPLPLSRFRGKGLMMEIGTDDLRFTSEETTSLSIIFDTPTLDSGSIEIIQDKTEGWVTGLKMALLSMHGEDNVDSFISGFSRGQRYIMDYLIEEVLHRQPEEIQEFLLKTSVLENLCGTLCDTVSGSSNGTDMLHQLEKDNLFIVPLDAAGEWYRYEHLFADLLCHRLDAVYGKEVVDELQKKASLWYESNGFPKSAIKYALAVEDWERALSIILAPVTPLITYNVYSLAEWWKELPRDVVINNTWAGIIFSRVLAYSGQFEETVSLLNSVKHSENYDVKYEGHIAGIRANIAAMQDDPKIEEYAKTAFSLLPSDDVSRVSMSYRLALYYIKRMRLNEAETVLWNVYELACKHHAIGTDPGSILYGLAITSECRGKFREAEKLLKRADQFNPLVSHMALAQIYYVWNDLDAAEAELEKISSLPLGDYGEAPAYFYLHVCRIKGIRGDFQASAEAFKKAEQAGTKGPIAKSLQGILTAVHINQAYDLNDVEAVDYWLHKYLEYDVGSVVEFSVLVEVLISQKWPEEAKKRLDVLEELCRREAANGFLIQIYIIRALITADGERALSFLAQALEMAKIESPIRFFVDTGISLAPLLRKAITKGIEPEYCRKILSVIEIEEPRRKIMRGETPPPDSILSEKELEVLRLISEGFTNQQITEKLFITINTTKTHIRHIYNKLGVDSRTQALSRARELGIL